MLILIKWSIIGLDIRQFKNKIYNSFSKEKDKNSLKNMRKKYNKFNSKIKDENNWKFYNNSKSKKENSSNKKRKNYKKEKN